MRIVIGGKERRYLVSDLGLWGGQAEVGHLDSERYVPGSGTLVPEVGQEARDKLDLQMFAQGRSQTES